MNARAYMRSALNRSSALVTRSRIAGAVLDAVKAGEHMISAPLLRNRLPTLLSLGASHGGTTWLWAQLMRHPEISGELKETVYWNFRYHRRTLVWYARLYEQGTPVRIDMSPNYLLLHPDRIAAIHHLLPDVRFVFVGRDPVERAWSTVRRRLPPQHWTPAAIDRQLSYLPMRSGMAEIEASQFHLGLANWLSVFPRDQVLALPFRHIAEAPVPLLERVFEFLGVAADRFDWSEVTHQINKGPDWVDIPPHVREYLAARYDGVRRATEELVGPIDW